MEGDPAIVVLYIIYGLLSEKGDLEQKESLFFYFFYFPFINFIDVKKLFSRKRK